MIAWFGIEERTLEHPGALCRCHLCAAAGYLYLALPAADSTSPNFKVAQILLSIGSVNCIVMWAFQCIVYIRYHSRRTKYQQKLTGFFAKFQHSSRTTHFATKPVVARVGLIGCILLLCLFNSASLSNDPRSSA